MVAMLALAVVLIGTAALLRQTGVSIWNHAHSRTATEVANDILEDALSVDYDSLTDSATSVTRNGITYSVSRNVTEYNLPIIYKEVDVSISYRGETISAMTFVIDGFGIQ
jgi:metal-dependent HD superfamily phosphatase/phosphodiesterase